MTSRNPIDGKTRDAAQRHTGITRCPGCRALGYTHDLFCALCGETMLRDCGRCGARVVHPVAYYCTRCGSSLDGSTRTIDTGGRS